MSERPVPLFVPPEGRRSAPPAVIPIPPVPVTYPEPSLELGIATVNADGRVREKKLIVDDLGWSSRDRTSTRIVADGIVVHRTQEGGDGVDSRGQVLIPASPRALYGIAVGDRVVLVAVPEHEVLVVHSTAFVASLLAKHYAATGVLNGC